MELSINRQPPQISGFIVQGYGMRTYCKITEYAPRNIDNYRCTFSIGTGMNKFCMNASFNIKHHDDIYIDRVEHKKYMYS